MSEADTGTPRSVPSVRSAASAAESHFSSSSHRYVGRHAPALKYDNKAGKDMPAWSSSIFAVWSNSQMAMCALTGVGVCVMHGHNQDAMNSNGCVPSCSLAMCVPGECGRQRRFLRKRLHMPGGEYVCGGWLGDCTEAVFCLPLAVMQESREIEIRSRRKWHWLRGFRGRGETLATVMFGEETFDRVLAPYDETVRNVLQDGFFEVQDSEDGGTPRSGVSQLKVPPSVDSMAR